MLMNNFFKITTFLSNDKKYLFSNCCFLSNDIVIGDYEQTVLAGTLKLSFTDLLDRLMNYKLINFNSNEINKFFNIFSGDINNSCLPTCVESFDGNFGILCFINNEEYLVVKKWDCPILIKVKINKQDYIDCVLKAIKKIDG